MKANRNKIVVAVILIVAIIGIVLYMNREPLGEIQNITTSQLEEKIENDDSFAVVLTQASCGHCKTFLSMMETYLKDHEMIMYDVIFDLEENRNKALTTLETIFPEFVGTPDIYYIENGEVKSNLNRELQKGDKLDETAFHAWVEKYNIIKK